METRVYLGSIVLEIMFSHCYWKEINVQCTFCSEFNQIFFLQLLSAFVNITVPLPFFALSQPVDPLVFKWSVCVQFKVNAVWIIAWPFLVFYMNDYNRWACIFSIQGNREFLTFLIIYEDVPESSWNMYATKQCIVSKLFVLNRYFNSIIMKFF